MSLLAGDRLTQVAFSIFQNRGVYALLIGSGISRAAEIPTGWEITLDLVRRVALAQGEKDGADWADWYRNRTGSEPNYSDLLAELALSPDERRAILHAYIEPTDEDREAGRKVPTRAHRAIADLVAAGFIRVIITTNFDRLLETALRDRGVEPTVIASPDALQGAEPLTHSQCYVLKLHGDYKDARILNTDQELRAYPKAYNQLLDRIFDEHGLLISGWSGAWDHALRAALMRAKSRRYSLFWAVRGAVGDGAQEIIDQRRGVILPINDADTFFGGLQERVVTLQQSARRDPLTVDLIVASAKRYLARAEYRIQLDDLIVETAGDWLARIPNFGTEQVDAKVWMARASQHEAASEAMAKLCLVLGRWGSDQEFDATMDTISLQVAKADEMPGGFVAPAGLRSYPSVLAFTGYALGLIRAGRWKTLHRFLTAPLVRKNEKAQRVVDALLNWAWQGTTDDVWKRVEGYERRHTAFSDMQCDLFKEWSLSVLGLVPDFELLYERFEFLGALAHFEKGELPTIEQALNNENSDYQWVFMPVGRVSWDRARRAKLREELESAEFRTELSNAGFGRGDTRYFDLFLKNLAWLRGRMY